MNANQTALVPPRRLGSLLRQARMSSGTDLDALASTSKFGPVELEDIEEGRRQLDEQQLADVLTVYGIENTGLLPERSQLIIDLDQGRIAVDRSDIVVGPTPDTDAVLTRYLALVYRLRELPLGTPLNLRDIDLDVLSTALSIEPQTIGSRLEQLMLQREVVRTDQRKLRRQLLVPLAGVIVAATAVGVLVLVSQINDNSTPTNSPSTRVTTDIGVGGAVVDNPAAQITTDIGNGGAVEVNPSADAGG